MVSRLVFRGGFASTWDFYFKVHQYNVITIVVGLREKSIDPAQI